MLEQCQNVILKGKNRVRNFEMLEQCWNVNLEGKNKVILKCQNNVRM